MQVWLAYSAVTGYLLYLCSAKRRMAPTTPKRVSYCLDHVLVAEDIRAVGPLFVTTSSSICPDMML